MTTATVAAPEAVFALMHEIGSPIVEKMSAKYSSNGNSPFTSREDFEQDVWSRLWEWLTDPSHVETAVGLLEDTTETKRWLTQFCRGRCCDLVDVIMAGTRDQRKTLTASQTREEVVGYTESNSRETLLEWVAAHESTDLNQPGSEYEALEAIRADIGRDTDALRIFDILLDPPALLRESFVESRLRAVRGMATLTEADTRHGVSTVLLSVLEGYAIEDQEVTWTGRLPSFGRLDTDQGECVVTSPEKGLAVLRWTETKLTVRLDRATHEGEFLREVIRPSPRAFDLAALRDCLGISGLRIRKAWLRLNPILRSKLGAA